MEFRLRLDSDKEFQRDVMGYCDDPDAMTNSEVIDYIKYVEESYRNWCRKDCNGETTIVRNDMTHWDVLNIIVALAENLTVETMQSYTVSYLEPGRVTIQSYNAHDAILMAKESTSSDCYGFKVV